MSTTQMNPRRSTDPTLEPITLAEAKVFMRVDHADEDTLITSLITTAREMVEDYTGLALITQNWIFILSDWPHKSLSLFSTGSRSIDLPRGLLLDIVSVTTYDDDDVPTVWASSNYYVARFENRLYRRTTSPWPSDIRDHEGIEIIFQIGFGPTATDVPAALRQATLHLITHLYENREPMTDTPMAAVPLTLRDQLDGYRRRRI